MLVTSRKIVKHIAKRCLVKVTAFSAISNHFQTFTANTNSDDVVNIDLPEPVVARYLKIVILSWNTHPALRMEVIGYDCSG